MGVVLTPKEGTTIEAEIGIKGEGVAVAVTTEVVAAVAAATFAFACYDERREGIIALGRAYTLGHITGMKEGRKVI